jgi:xanthine dehydrogenase accessory factor
MLDIYDKLNQLRSENVSSALVTVIATKGSTPRDTGAKMIVCADGKIYGTIGGSVVEAMVIEEARECLKKNLAKKVWHDLDDKEKADTGMICGGKMEFFIEPVTTSTHLYIFGGGHVALPLARVATTIGFSYTIVEDRPEFATADRFPDAKELILANPDEIEHKVKFTDTDYVAIVTRSHELDYQALKKVLKSSVKYIGLIASKVKKKQVFEQLSKEGYSEQTINQIHSPIGLDIAAQTPEEIAISIVAELIKVKNNSGI